MAENSEQFDHTVIAPGALDRSKGETIPLRVEGSDEVHEAVVNDVTYADGAVSVDLTIPEGLLGGDRVGFSIGPFPEADDDRG